MRYKGFNTNQENYNLLNWQMQWLASKSGLALIFQFKNSLVKKFVVHHRNCQILFYLPVSRCLHTMYRADRGNQASKLLRCYHPVQDIVLYTDLVMYQASVFLQRTKCPFCILCTIGKISNYLFIFFFFLKMGEAFIPKVFLILLFKLHVVSPLIVKNK